MGRCHTRSHPSSRSGRIRPPPWPRPHRPPPWTPGPRWTPPKSATPPWTKPTIRGDSAAPRSGRWPGKRFASSWTNIEERRPRIWPRLRSRNNKARGEDLGTINRSEEERVPCLICKWIEFIWKILPGMRAFYASTTEVGGVVIGGH